jgi:hypothetical protein
MAWDWGKKLGGQQPAPQPTRAPSPYGPGVLPRGMGVDHGRVIDHYMDQRQPQQAPYQPQQSQQFQPPQYKPPDPKDPNGHMDNVWNYQGNFRGGAAETANLGNCPNCQSPRFFSRQNGGSAVTTDHGVFYPAPECIDCGYPKEQGVLATAGAGRVGSAQIARGVEAAPPLGSLEYLKR